jgi:hypothetical protein
MGEESTGPAGKPRVPPPTPALPEGAPASGIEVPHNVGVLVDDPERVEVTSAPSAAQSNKVA